TAAAPAPGPDSPMLETVAITESRARPQKNTIMASAKNQYQARPIRPSNENRNWLQVIGYPSASGRRAAARPHDAPSAGRSSMLGAIGAAAHVLELQGRVVDAE